MFTNYTANYTIGRDSSTDFSSLFNSRPERNEMKKIIIGIDPGSLNFGYSALLQEGSHITSLDFGVLRPKALSPLQERLFYIFSAMEKIFTRYPPALVSIEEVFYHKNIRSAVVLAQARAIGLILASRFGAELREYSAKKIKLSVTGTGTASKEAVQRMICKILRLEEGMRLDASDAIAIGLCAHLASLSPFTAALNSSGKPKKKISKSGGWSLDAIQNKGLRIRS